MAPSEVASEVGGGAAFRDAEGFPVVGGRCSLRECNVHDFLPVVCGFCQAPFCDLHAAPDQHSCQRAPPAVAGRRATVCPACEETLRWDTADSTEESTLEAHLAACPGRRRPRELCPNPRCGVELGLLNAFTCATCQQRVCIGGHRFEDDAHPCRRPRPAPPAAGEPAGAGAGAGGAPPLRGLAGPSGLAEARAQLGGTTVARGECLYSSWGRLGI
ncbi:unnamed protein product [Prorocentrum cordatum]|uniref:AN1-type domain-containing protein n=1 Tax=Prorocentrum cordatum TaxID=2364126 RepID=A0ABN9P9S1_9DINO|nr:unnamed protein product [Polarella glacialis]